MPGLTACMKCNTVLMAAVPVSVHPPRAGWKRRWRPLFYGLNRLGERVPALREGWVALPGWLRGCRRFLAGLLWAVLSLVPGLGHLLSGRVRPLRRLWPAWAVTAAAGVFFLGTQGGSLLLGLAVALHVWIICDAGRLRELFETALARALLVMLVYSLLALHFYPALRRQLEARWVRGALLTADLQTDGLRRGDFLLAWPQAYARDAVRRGDVILYDVAASGGRGYGGVAIRGGETVGKVLGLPGERVQAGEGLLTITAPQGTVTRYLIRPPAALPWAMDFRLPPDGYFCLTVGVNTLDAHGHVNAEMRDIFQQIGQLARPAIRGRVVWVYQPLGRRARLPRRPLEAAP